MISDYIFSYIIECLSVKQSITFVQVGANDGVTADPIYFFCKKYKWSGVLVEPVPYIFSQLKESYAGYDENLIFENCAISNSPGETSFYEFNEGSTVPSYKALGSLDKNQLLQYCRTPEHRADIHEWKVNCITLMELLEKYNYKQLDLLVIDAEGYDARILMSLDLNLIKPKVIYYESMNVPAIELQPLEANLKENGYELYTSFIPEVSYNDRDTVAILSDLKPKETFPCLEALVALSQAMRNQARVIKLVTQPGRYETVQHSSGAMIIKKI